jgi:NDP-sugar pyrophosphorylase family protein
MILHAMVSFGPTEKIGSSDSSRSLHPTRSTRTCPRRTLCARPEVLELIDQDKPVSIEREIFPTLAKRRTLFGLFPPGYWLDVGTPESYLLAHHDLLSRPG